MWEQRHANRNEMKPKKITKNRKKRGNQWVNALNEYKYSLKVERENHDEIDWNRHQSTRSRSTIGRKDETKQKIQNTFSMDVIITLNYFNLVLLSLSVCRVASSRRRTSNETNSRQKKHTKILNRQTEIMHDDWTWAPKFVSHATFFGSIVRFFFVFLCRRLPPFMSHISVVSRVLDTRLNNRH